MMCGIIERDKNIIKLASPTAFSVFWHSNDNITRDKKKSNVYVSSRNKTFLRKILNYHFLTQQS